MDENWKRLQRISRQLTDDYPDAVFIGGIAVAAYARRLGDAFIESSHDVDLYMSLVGKAALRDRYEVRRNPHLGKDSALIEGEDVDLYIEHQHPLGVPYDAIAAYAETVDGIRVAALEHLFVLKLDACASRTGTGKGEKDVRDLARIIALIEEPREALLRPYMTTERAATLGHVSRRTDLPRILGLNPHDGSKFRKQLDGHVSAIERLWGKRKGRDRV